jgi:hypothetical protein
MRAKLVYGKNSMTWANRVYAYTNRRETATPNYQPHTTRTRIPIVMFHQECRHNITRTPTAPSTRSNMHVSPAAGHLSVVRGWRHRSNPVPITDNPASRRWRLRVVRSAPTCRSEQASLPRHIAYLLHDQTTADCHENRAGPIISVVTADLVGVAHFRAERLCVKSSVLSAAFHCGPGFITSNKRTKTWLN